MAEKQCPWNLGLGMPFFTSDTMWVQAAVAVALGYWSDGIERLQGFQATVRGVGKVKPQEEDIRLNDNKAAG